MLVGILSPCVLARRKCPSLMTFIVFPCVYSISYCSTIYSTFIPAHLRYAFQSFRYFISCSFQHLFVPQDQHSLLFLFFLPPPSLILVLSWHTWLSSSLFLILSWFPLCPQIVPLIAINLKFIFPKLLHIYWYFPLLTIGYCLIAGSALPLSLITGKNRDNKVLSTYLETVARSCTCSVEPPIFFP